MSQKTELDEREIEAALRGKALQVYWFLMSSSDPVGVRDIQRNLGFSSPSVAHHHLDKLRRLGLIAQDEHGRYFIAKQVEVGILQAFVKMGRLMLPRFAFYGVFFTTLLAFYLYLFALNANVYAVTIAGIASGFSWYEAYRAWKRRPF